MDDAFRQATHLRINDAHRDLESHPELQAACDP
jgi:hypothetical protein